MNILQNTRFAMDDIKVRYKLILLYILCVLVPVATTNFIFYHNISKGAGEQQAILLRESLQRINAAVMNIIGSCIDISDILYKDPRLNVLLTKRYVNYNDYSQAYNIYLKDYISKYGSLYKQIYELGIYVTNSSIFSGGGYYYVDNAIKGIPWFTDALSYTGNVMINEYSDKNTLDTMKKNTARYFSIIRRLDYFHYGSVTKILKIDIDYNFINKILKEESTNTDTFIVDKYNNIIFSNDDSYSSFSKESIPFGRYIQKSNTVLQRQNMTGVMNGYKIIIAAPRTVVLNDLKGSSLYLGILIFINLVLPSIIIRLISISFKNRLEMLADHMKNLRHDKMNLIHCSEGRDEIGELISEFNTMAVRMDKLIKDVYEASIQQKNLEIARKQAELNALQSQINPHFLFNTLEAIRMRSLLKEELETSQIIKYLSKILRRTSNWSNDLITISEEIFLIEEFLKIQTYRFEDKLKYSISVNDEVKGWKIPKLSMMTLVENACIHGIEKSARIGTVEISVENIKERVRIIVKDDGIGMSEEIVADLMNLLKNQQIEDLYKPSQSIGIKNVYMRLKLFYENDFSFCIRSKESEGTEIELEIPYDVKRD